MYERSSECFDAASPSIRSIWARLNRRRTHGNRSVIRSRGFPPISPSKGPFRDAHEADKPAPTVCERRRRVLVLMTISTCDVPEQPDKCTLRELLQHDADSSSGLWHPSFCVESESDKPRLTACMRRRLDSPYLFCRSSMKMSIDKGQQTMHRLTEIRARLLGP
jgi:hypothetical protein